MTKSDHRGQGENRESRQRRRKRGTSALCQEAFGSVELGRQRARRTGRGGDLRLFLPSCADSARAPIFSRLRLASASPSAIVSMMMLKASIFLPVRKALGNPQQTLAQARETAKKCSSCWTSDVRRLGCKASKRPPKQAVRLSQRATGRYNWL
jgi:hypothetical protein